MRSWISLLAMAALGAAGVAFVQFAADTVVGWRAVLLVASALVLGAVLGVLGLRIWPPHWLVAMADFNVSLLEAVLRDECANRREFEKRAAVAEGENEVRKFEVARLEHALMVAIAERDAKSDELRRRDIGGEVPAP